MQVTQDLDKRLVVKAKSCKMLNLLHLAHFVNHLVITRTQKTDKPILVAGSLYAGNNLGAFFPFMHKGRNHFHRILKVAAHGNNAIALHLGYSIIGRIELAKIAGVKNSLDFFIFFANLAQKRSCIVRGIVVYKDDFIIVGRTGLLQHVLYRMTYLNNITLFIKTGN